MRAAALLSIFSESVRISAMRRIQFVTVTLALVLTSPCAWADQLQNSDQPDLQANQQERFMRFAESLSGVKLIGRFTILGKEDAAPKDEEYTINKVTKMPSGDYWLFSARIKYGEHDFSVPLPLQVKWAGDTPMITLTDLNIAGQGPFSARVIFYNNKYAGTWSHGDAGGHMFGRIVKLEEQTQDDKGESDPARSDTN
jgi:hypothetical protein